MTARLEPEQDSLDAFDEVLAKDGLEGHWRLGNSITAQPEQRARPQIWPWEKVHRHLIHAGEIVGMEQGAQRRTLRLISEGSPYRGTTPTFQTSIQLVKPGEIAEAHRHSMTAFRFVLQGTGGFTTVQGERFVMEPHDLVLTPQWSWHDHGNETDGPMIWIDGLDFPFIQSLNAVFFEPFAAKQQDLIQPEGYHNDRYGPVRPAGAQGEANGVPYIYKGREALQILGRLGPQDRDPCDGLTLRYANPSTGGPTLPTIECRLHLLDEGPLAPRRHTANSIYHVIEGAGESQVGSDSLAWGPGDTFLVPTWTWCTHNVHKGARAVFFSIRDDPIFKAFGLYRREDSDS